MHRLVIFLLQSTIILGTVTRIQSLQMSSTVKLSHRQNNFNVGAGHVPLLLIHGLDSSSHTWRSILSELKTPAVAIDVRGCGSSDLGSPDDFSPDSIVEDIHEFVSSHDFFQRVGAGDSGSDDADDDLKKNTQKFVICGHSMVRREFSIRFDQSETLHHALVV